MGKAGIKKFRKDIWWRSFGVTGHVGVERTSPGMGLE